MSDEFSWFCFKAVLPKIEYNYSGENDNHIHFYKDGEPIAVLEKRHRYNPLTIQVILERIRMPLEEFKQLIQQCNIQNKA